MNCGTKERAQRLAGLFGGLVNSQRKPLIYQDRNYILTELDCRNTVRFPMFTKGNSPTIKDDQYCTICFSGETLTGYDIATLDNQSERQTAKLDRSLWYLAKSASNQATLSSTTPPLPFSPLRQDMDSPRRPVPELALPVPELARPEDPAPSSSQPLLGSAGTDHRSESSASNQQGRASFWRLTCSYFSRRNSSDNYAISATTPPTSSPSDSAAPAPNGAQASSQPHQGEELSRTLQLFKQYMVQLNSLQQAHAAAQSNNATATNNSDNTQALTRRRPR